MTRGRSPSPVKVLHFVQGVPGGPGATQVQSADDLYISSQSKEGAIEALCAARDRFQEALDASQMNPHPEIADLIAEWEQAR